MQIQSPLLTETRPFYIQMSLDRSLGSRFRFEGNWSDLMMWGLNGTGVWSPDIQLMVLLHLAAFGRYAGLRGKGNETWGEVPLLLLVLPFLLYNPIRSQKYV